MSIGWISATLCLLHIERGNFPVQGGFVALQNRGRFVLLILCLGLCLLCAVPVCAGGVVVSPAKIAAEVTMGSKLPPITIYNGSDEKVSVEVSIGEGRHDLWGVPIMTGELRCDDPSAPLDIRPAKFVLDPGRSQIVQARVAQPVQGGLYPVIYFSIRSEESGAAAIQADKRLCVLTLLTEPRGAVPIPVVEDVFLSQSEKGAPVRLASIVSNPGHRHLTIYGQMTISDSKAEQNTRLYLPPVTILPGCSRQLEVVWRPEDLPEGIYQGALALQVEGGKGVQRDFPILAVGPYEIAQPLLETGGWRAQAAALSGKPILEGVVRNGGNVPLSPMVEVEVGGIEPLATPVAVGTLNPGEAKLVEIPLPQEMEGGVYDLKVLVEAKTYGGLVKQAVDYELKVEEANVVALSPALP